MPFVELWKSYKERNDCTFHINSLTYIYCCLKVKPSMGDAHSHSFIRQTLHECIAYVLTALVCWPIAKANFLSKENKCTVLLMQPTTAKHFYLFLSLRCLIYCLMIAIKCLKAKKEHEKPVKLWLTEKHKVYAKKWANTHKENWIKEKKKNIIVSSNYFMNGCTGRKLTNKQTNKLSK